MRCVLLSHWSVCVTKILLVQACGCGYTGSWSSLLRWCTAKTLKLGTNSSDDKLVLTILSRRIQAVPRGSDVFFGSLTTNQCLIQLAGGHPRYTDLRGYNVSYPMPHFQAALMPGVVLVHFPVDRLISLLSICWYQYVQYITLKLSSGYLCVLQYCQV